MLLQINRGQAGDWTWRNLNYVLFREVMQFGLGPPAPWEFHLTYTLALVKAQMLIASIPSSTFIDFKTQLFQRMNKSPG